MKSESIFSAARRAFASAAPLRARRTRFKNYTYGRQWDDPITTPDGQTISEYEYAYRSGKQPLTNNMIRQLIKSIVGRFRHNIATDATADNAAERPEAIDELDARMLEEFLISGCAVQYVTREEGRVKVENIPASRFFVNAFSDPAGRDIELVGRLRDMSLPEVVMRYAHGSPARSRTIRDLYARSATGVASLLGDPADDGSGSFTDAPRGRCRVVEVWVREGRELLKCHDADRAVTFWLDPDSEDALQALNRSGLQSPISYRSVTSLRWHGYFFGPDGTLLDETLSPYAHGSHPFAVKLYPLTDGEVHPFVEDIIDQQRYINRLITLIDHIMSFSAKGVLLFPISQKPDELSWDDISRQWCQPNGIIPYNDTGTGEPRQIYSQGGLQGASELLNLEMRLLEQISGVSSALRGQQVAPSTGVKMYESQVENATISLLDIYETFNSFRAARDRLINNC